MVGTQCPSVAAGYDLRRCRPMKRVSVPQRTRYGRGAVRSSARAREPASPCALCTRCRADGSSISLPTNARRCRGAIPYPPKALLDLAAGCYHSLPLFFSDPRHWGSLCRVDRDGNLTILQEHDGKPEHAQHTEEGTSVLQTGKQTLEPTGGTERSSAAAIRFSGADGRVLSWTAAAEKVRTHPRLHREMLHCAPVTPWQTDPSQQDDASVESHLHLEPIQTEASSAPRSNWTWAAYLVTSSILAAFVVVCWVTGAI
jgi:hypothetical protein